MAQFFILFCAVVTFAIMACDPRPAEFSQTASAWDKSENNVSISQHGQKNQSQKFDNNYPLKRIDKSIALTSLVSTPIEI